MSKEMDFDWQPLAILCSINNWIAATCMSHRMELERVVRYLIVGVINTGTYISVSVVMTDFLKFHAMLGSMVGFLLALLIAFIFNRTWTFGSIVSIKSSLIKYIIIGIYGLILNAIVMHVVVNIYNSIHYFGLLFLSIVMPVSNYFLMKKWAFRQ
jgi:putative flippase GtrA